MKLVDRVDRARIVDEFRQRLPQVRHLRAIGSDDSDGRRLLEIGTRRKFFESVINLDDDFGLHVVANSDVVLPLHRTQLCCVDKYDRRFDVRVDDFRHPRSVDNVRIVESDQRSFGDLLGAALQLVVVGQAVCQGLDVFVHSVLEGQGDDVVLVFEVAEQRIFETELSSFGTLNDGRKLLWISDENESKFSRKINKSFQN